MNFKLIALTAFFSAVIAAPTPVNDAAAGQCEGADNACNGVATHWDGGLGACGWNVDTKSSKQIALPHDLMGPQSNGNPYCGRKVTITANGHTTEATVGDKCMGCEGTGKIDLTDVLFEEFGDLSAGVVQGVTWYFS